MNATALAPGPQSVLSEPGSFRDRGSRVFYVNGEVYRGLSTRAAQDWALLSKARFFRRFMEQGLLVHTRGIQDQEIPPAILDQGWTAFLQHERIPFVSYPYEWCFGMLRDAALVQLELMEAALEEDLILKDASAFNVQWHGTQPVFIDIPSFERHKPGEPWAGYRQFCQLFLYPLMLQAYKRLPFQVWLRGSLDGVTPDQMNRLMTIRDWFRAGVFPHVFLQAKLQAGHAETERDVRDDLRVAGFHKSLIKANVRRLRKLVGKLEWKEASSEWSDYQQQNSYSKEADTQKRNFMREVVESRPWNLVWDLGCNTGVFSRIAAKNARYVLAVDADHLTVERLYQRLRADNNRRILPLVCNLADPSPNLGWRGLERTELIARGKPDLVLCLALVHHLVIGANIPLREVIDWLADLGADLVIEFVDRHDPMVQTLLRNREDQFVDYEHDFFKQCLAARFDVARREGLSNQTRTLYFARARR
jgi:SAM-dependent methyltransferase